jgi:hypothetical protein
MGLWNDFKSTIGLNSSNTPAPLNIASSQANAAEIQKSNPNATMPELYTLIAIEQVKLDITRNNQSPVEAENRLYQQLADNNLKISNENLLQISNDKLLNVPQDKISAESKKRAEADRIKNQANIDGAQKANATLLSYTSDFFRKNCSTEDLKAIAASNNERLNQITAASQFISEVNKDISVALKNFPSPHPDLVKNPTTDEQKNKNAELTKSRNAERNKAIKPLQEKYLSGFNKHFGESAGERINNDGTDNIKSGTSKDFINTVLAFEQKLSAKNGAATGINKALSKTLTKKSASTNLQRPIPQTPNIASEQKEPVQNQAKKPVTRREYDSSKMQTLSERNIGKPVPTHVTTHDLQHHAWAAPKIVIPHDLAEGKAAWGKKGQPEITPEEKQARTEELHASNKAKFSPEKQFKNKDKPKYSLHPNQKETMEGGKKATLKSPTLATGKAKWEFNPNKALDRLTKQGEELAKQSPLPDISDAQLNALGQKPDQEKQSTLSGIPNTQPKASARSPDPKRLERSRLMQAGIAETRPPQLSGNGAGFSSELRSQAGKWGEIIKSSDLNKNPKAGKEDGNLNSPTTTPRTPHPPPPTHSR